MSTKLLAASLLKDELSDDDKIHGALFSAAFEELDELRKRLEKIPAEVDRSAAGFQQITTRAVDDFVTVANEALSKFIQRTNEIKATLASLERTTAPLIARGAVQMPVPLPAEISQTQPVASQPAGRSGASRLWWTLPLSIGAGVAIGALVVFFMLREPAWTTGAVDDTPASSSVPVNDSSSRHAAPRKRSP